MATKIIYGIDLGTTNSAIARFEKGKAVIKKSSLQGDTTPSCVSVTPRGRILVGSRAYFQYQKDLQLVGLRDNYQINSFIEFKRLMGTNETIFSSNVNKHFTPEELSSEVLKELRKYVLDDDVKTAVITVPAMFNNNQKDATKRAAKMAGFDHYELIQEPVAASVAYGLGSKMKDAYWLVFDFGGGTFDAALMKIEDGIMKAIDTAGNNHLGGKDLDNAIVEQIFIPYFEERYCIDQIMADRKRAAAFKQMWKPKAEEAKIQLSFNDSYDVQTDVGEDYGTDDNGEPFELDITLTQEQYRRVAEPIYQQAIDRTLGLLEKHNISGDQLGALILVGGPTHSPIVREMLRQQVTDKVDTSIDPMTCVACGAALYASTLDIPDEIVDKQRDRSKIQLKIEVKSTTVEDMESAVVKLLPDKCDNFADNEVLVEFVRSDGAFQTGKVAVDKIGDILDLKLNRDCTNVFSIRCYNKHGDALECEPDTISIIQGIDGVGDSVLSLSLGVGAINKNGDEVFTKIAGLERSHILPADGTIDHLYTRRQVRPGNAEDTVRITIYQVADFTDNTKALYCTRLYEFYLTGDDIPSLLSANQELKMHMHADKSGTIDKFIIDIPYLDYTLDVTDRLTISTQTAVSTSFLRDEMRSARKKAEEMQNQELIDAIDEQSRRLEEAPDDRDRKDQVLDSLREICREVDAQYALGDWERMEKKLRGMFKELEEDNKKYGNAQTTEQVEAMRGEVDNAIRKKDVDYGQQVYDAMWGLDYKIAEVEFYIVWILNWKRDFNHKSWSDRVLANTLINQGLSIINNGPTADKLRPIAFQLLDLLPSDEAPTNVPGRQDP